jgi:4-amino-4-deoxy-L-arabinose transferase-like glycosyltransferase
MLLVSWVGGLLVAVQAAAVVLHALAWPVHDPDAWSIWAFKARIFYMSQTLPLSYFHDASKLFSHPDYPLLVPLAETWAYSWMGRPDDWAVMALSPLFYLATLAMVAGALARVYGRAAGLAGALALALVPVLFVQGSAGDADVPLALMAAGSAVFLWRWLCDETAGRASRRALVLCGAFTALGVWTKKEGLLLLLCTALIVVVAAWRRHVASGEPAAALRDGALFLSPVLVVAGPWLAFLALDRPLTRDFLPITVSTLLAHLDRLPTICSFLGLRLLDVPHWNVAWALLAAVAVLGRRQLGRGSALGYLLALLVLQIAADGAVFIFSDWQPYTAHLQTSLDRLLLHSLPLAVLLLVALGQHVQLRRTAP